jgi:hypothetical protein
MSASSATEWKLTSRAAVAAPSAAGADAGSATQIRISRPSQIVFSERGRLSR